MGLIGRFLLRQFEREAKAHRRRAALDTPSLGLGIGEESLAIPTNWQTLYSIYRKHADVYACVREWADGVGGNGFRWINAGDPEEKPVAKSVERIVRVLIGKFVGQTPQSLLRNTVKHLGIAGNAFWILNKSNGGGEVVEVQLVSPKYMKIVVQNEDVKQYVQERPGHDAVAFEVDEVVHFKPDADTDNEIWGMSPLETLVWEARSDLGAMWSNYRIFVAGQSAAHYILDEALNEEEVKRAIQRIREQLSGVKNRHRPVVLQGVKEVRPLDLSPKEMEFAELRKLATEKICAAYGVPKSLIGYRDTANEATASKTDRRNFHENTIRPLEEYFMEKINLELLPKLGLEDIAFAFKPTSFEEIEDTEKRSAELVKNALLTVNEARQRMGLKPVTDNAAADELLAFTGAGPIPLALSATGVHENETGELLKAITRLEHEAQLWRVSTKRRAS